MKFGVVTFPGSNCDQDMVRVLRDTFGQDVSEIWHKDDSLTGFDSGDCIVLPGGFSFGDYLRTGAIARFSPVMSEVIRFAGEGGMVWGICNGFQILCEAHLLPGALLRNDNQRYVCKNVHLRCGTPNSALTSALTPGEVLRIPIAHAEGRYQADPEVLEELEANNQVLFRYCDETGQVDGAANPNGSVGNIAGICNAGRNVFGMMPHPERAAEEVLGNRDGARVFESLLALAPA